MGRIIGIDLGTTNSLAAYWKNGEVHLIPNAFASFLTPSVVSVGDEGVVYVGKVAKERLATHPEDTVSIFKRTMGTDKKYSLQGTLYSSTELSAFVLKKLKEDAEHFLGEPVEEAVISVPAYFSEPARRATRDAGLLAGLKVERIVNEPSAAALACRNMGQKDGKFLVFDFGGGTLDVSLVECYENMVEIIAVSGNNRLGGTDFDRIIADYFCVQNGRKFDEQRPEVQQQLLSSAEIAKRKLSLRSEVSMEVSIDGFSKSVELTRKDLVSLSSGIFKEMLLPVQKVLRDGKTTSREIGRIVLVGGSCKMPIVQQYIQYIIPDCEITAVDPDYMVALGTGVFAGIKERQGEVSDIMLMDICPFSLGVKVRNKADHTHSIMSFLIERNSSLPVSRTGFYCNALSGQTVVQIEIYQGESMYADENQFLGMLNIAVPPKPVDEAKVRVTFRYDINGLFVVEAMSLDYQEKKLLVFEGGRQIEADESVRKKIEAFDARWSRPENREDIQLLLARAERAFLTLTGSDREILEKKVISFMQILKNGKMAEIERAKEEISATLTFHELQISIWNDVDDPDNFVKWYEEAGND